MQGKLVRSMTMIIVILIGEYNKDNEKKCYYSSWGGGVFIIRDSGIRVLGASA